MSTYVYMKVLEGSAQHYDSGIRRLSSGHIDAYYDEIARRSCGAGKRVLDVGCGTGGLTLACARRGAEVVGIDRNPEMLEVARSKASSLSLEEPIEWIELGALEIEDRFAESSFDAVVSSLMFSELLAEEQDYVLATAFSRLRPGGTVVIGDETVPDTRAGRLAHALRRLPSTALTYLFAQSTTRPVTGLAERLRRAGFENIDEMFFDHHTFVVAQGWKPT